MIKFSEEILAPSDVPKVYHICGDTNMIIADMAGMDEMRSPSTRRTREALSREKMGDEMVLLGNLHPWDVLTQGTPEEVREAGGGDLAWTRCGPGATSGPTPRWRTCRDG